MHSRILVDSVPRLLLFYAHAMSSRLEDEEQACKVQEVCRRYFIYNCFVKAGLVGLAMLRQAERICQLELGSNF